jgi:hypothetical protein
MKKPKPRNLDTRLFRDLAMALDRAKIFRACVGQPDPWQRDLLESDSKRALLLCCRQSGKSTVTASLALWEALFVPASLTLLVSPSLRQSGELFRKVAEFYHKLEGPGEVENESVLRLELRNGSRVIALPGSEATVRGYSGADLIVIDEASRVDDLLLAAIRPAAATKAHARMIYLSTPFGKRGFFWKAWSEGGNEWERFEVPASACPRISAAFLADERRALGEFIYTQEYENAWLDPETSVISSDLIEAAMSDERSFNF